MAKRFVLSATMHLPEGRFEEARRLADIEPLLSEFEQKFAALGGKIEHDVVQPRGPRSQRPNGAVEAPTDAVEIVSQNGHEHLGAAAD